MVIFGPRQVGKTTLIKEFIKTTDLKYKLDSGDDQKVANILSSQEFDKIIPYVKGLDVYILDEAQRIPNIGMGLKILVDQVPGIKIIATGSSSFELAGQVGEPLTGRKTDLTLYPIAQMELLKIHREAELKSRLEEWLLFGGYPAIVEETGEKEKTVKLGSIVNSYLLKDILELDKIKNSRILIDLLTLLAFQIGREVSLSELGRQLALDYKTVARYLDLLEKSFVIFIIRSFHINLRKAIAKKSRYYFYDNGIRNAIINNFNGLNLRNDVGQLWENFLAVERRKKQEYTNLYANNYFWRTWDGQEVDWVEERGGVLHGFEFKFSGGKKIKQPKDWASAYKINPHGKTSFQAVNPANYLDFLL